MVGALVRHQQYGEGRIVANNRGHLRVLFFGNNTEQEFGVDALNRGFLKRFLLEKGRLCQGGAGPCVIEQLATDGRGTLRTYHVQYEDGPGAICTEADLEPSTASRTLRPSARLAERDLDHLLSFRCREALRGAQLQNLRQGGHLMALLSARIDLHPHQAFVAGTVLDDRRRRYILADEVGLGKTIEAGVAIHDLLSANQAARVLIVCPGTLTQQWFCEIYSKFGGQVFTLLDLHADASVRWHALSHVIASMTQVTRYAGSELAKINWDLVVVDECHHLLSAPTLYNFVRDLARRTPAVLLLSAIPAQHKEDEFLRLLALLEPDRFSAELPESVEQFKTLYDNQAQLSRRLQPLVIRLRGMQTGEYTAEDVSRQTRRLLELPMLAQDQTLIRLAATLDGPQDQVKRTATRIIDHVADRYRVYRRILRNRRQVLIRDGRLQAVQRLEERETYPPGPREANALAAVNYLVQQAWRDGRDAPVIAIFAKLAWQSMASSDAALELLRPILTASAGALNAQGRDLLLLGHLTGYDDWFLYQELMQAAAAAFLPRELLREAVTALMLWNESDEQATRLRYLVQRLNKIWRRDRGSKILLFAGFPGIAEEIAVALTEAFGASVVAEFRSEMPREQKEDSAQRFQRDPNVRLLVSDETGGEGRNFAFADAVVHYDHPWQVSRIEQRIGRLDRIGRTGYRPDVTSIIISAAESIEDALIRCYGEGFGVYRDSISGLEFSLREQEETLITAALTDGAEGLCARISDLRQSALDERARDEHDALLDWASFQESRTERYLRVRTKTEVEQSLENAFVTYVQAFANTRAATPIHDEKTRDGLWRFKLDALPAGQIRDTGGEVIGTFRRAIAQQRLDREFFQIGNPFFDAITDAAMRDPFGRTYAVHCKSPAMPAWSGFEFVFCAQPNLTALSERRDLVQLLASYFWLPPMHVFVRLDGGVEQEPQRLRALRQSLVRQNKDRVWTNLWHERVSLLDAVFPADEWPQRVQEFSSIAEDNARALLGERLNTVLAEPRTKWESLSRQGREKGTHAALQEAETLDLLLTAMNTWDLYQEGAGFLAVNQYEGAR
jgi:ATP-dependent helicase HepA